MFTLCLKNIHNFNFATCLTKEIVSDTDNLNLIFFFLGHFNNRNRARCGGGRGKGISRVQSQPGLCNKFQDRQGLCRKTNSASNKPKVTETSQKNSFLSDKYYKHFIT